MEATNIAIHILEKVPNQFGNRIHDSLRKIHNKEEVDRNHKNSAIQEENSTCSGNGGLIPGVDG